ncbi:MAG: hypothetical protein QY316_09000 [Thermodesulfobacteriota bacterium]|nr:MAG: hypothetical protein QY316_09000 [Thermodesulfobacteriota bacterium]
MSTNTFPLSRADLKTRSCISAKLSVRPASHPRDSAKRLLSRSVAPPCISLVLVHAKREPVDARLELKPGAHGIYAEGVYGP